MLSINRHKIMKKTRNNKRAICSLEYEYKIEKISLVFFVFRLLTCLYSQQTIYIVYRN
jgi:hypothetical protein